MIHTNTQQKAPRACDSKGLHTNTNSADSRSHGAIQQAHDTKAIATQLARLALAGHHVIKGERGDYTVCKYGMTRYCANFAELQAFALKLGVNQ
jgi:hypothetical protein